MKFRWCSFVQHLGRKLETGYKKVTILYQYAATFRRRYKIKTQMLWHIKRKSYKRFLFTCNCCIQIVKRLRVKYYVGANVYESCANLIQDAKTTKCCDCCCRRCYFYQCININLVYTCQFVRPTLTSHTVIAPAN